MIGVRALILVSLIAFFKCELQTPKGVKGPERDNSESSEVAYASLKLRTKPTKTAQREPKPSNTYSGSYSMAKFGSIPRKILVGANAPDGTVIGKVTALDSNYKVNSPVTYYLEYVKPHTDIFGIKNKSGEIYTIGNISTGTHDVGEKVKYRVRVGVTADASKLGEEKDFIVKVIYGVDLNYTTDPEQGKKHLLFCTDCYLEIFAAAIVSAAFTSLLWIMIYWRMEHKRKGSYNLEPTPKNPTSAQEQEQVQELPKTIRKAEGQRTARMNSENELNSRDEGGHQADSVEVSRDGTSVAFNRARSSIGQGGGGAEGPVPILGGGGGSGEGEAETSAAGQAAETVVAGPSSQTVESGGRKRRSKAAPKIPGSGAHQI